MWDDADIEDDTPKPKAQDTPAAGEDAPAAAAEGEEAPTEEGAPAEVVKGTNEKLIFRHWVRPKFLQYEYMYDYRKNYYDNVISYLDRRNKGLAVEPPRAQTWGERVLRTYLSKHPRQPARQDAALLRGISSGARFHRYHSKSLISRKYSRLGFNTVSI